MFVAIIVREDHIELGCMDLTANDVSRRQPHSFDTQAEFHQTTGYLPITMAAYQLTEKSGFYKEKPGTDVAVTQMIRKTTDKSRGIRLGNFVQIRTILDEETEAIWSGKKEPKEALEAAMKRGNEQLERFEKASKAAAL